MPTTSYMVDLDERFAPPEEAMLEVTVQGDSVFLRPVKVTQNFTETHYAAAGDSVQVNVVDLINLLLVGYYSEHPKGG